MDSRRDSSTLPPSSGVTPPPLGPSAGTPSRPPGTSSPVPATPQDTPVGAVPSEVGQRPIPDRPVDPDELVIQTESDLSDSVAARMEPDDPVRQNLVNATPPWLISLLLHMGLLLVMGLILLPTVAPKALQISAQFADDFGDQLEEDSIRVALDDEESLEQVLTPDDLPEVEQPLVAPAEVQLDPLGLNSTSELIAPHIGVALTGREPGMKKALLAAYGGNAMTEEAVTMGLEWLKKNQLPDGSWSLAGPYADGGYNENPTAATAMALLAFLGAGNTHKAGNFKAVVKRGSDALLKMQKKDGDFFKGNVAHHRLYSQAQAMIAICELYGMTKDSRLREPAQLSVDYAVKTQDSLGGWRYRPGFDSDTSVTGWFVMGLQSAMMAGLEVPSETLERISGYLDRVVAADGARYGYQPGNDATYPMTAEALLCRQYLGWKKDDPRLQNGVEIIGDEPMNMQQRNVYYWYYATQVLHHMGGDAWDNWNRVMRKELPATQTRAGAERGSWSPIDDQWGTHGGRLYVTCLSLYMLEVYYRHLPIYQ